MALGQHPSHIVKQKTGPEDPELLETLEEALSQVDPQDLLVVADELAARRARFVDLLGSVHGVVLSQADRAWIARAVTCGRKKTAALAQVLALSNVPALATELVHGNGATPGRIAAFVNRLDGVDLRLRLELATGLLHYTYPQEHWLWTRWLWDASTQTGLLPLLAGSVRNLLADDVSEGYVRVGSVTAMSMRFAEGTGLLTPELVEHPKRQDYAADVFLACTYSIYLYGITTWRLSREYNRLLPALPNMMRWLVGLPKE